MAKNRTTIFRNGRIYTAIPQAPWAAAIAIRESRIVAVGSDADVSILAGVDAHVVNLAGRMMMPGIIDMHNHVSEGALARLFEMAIRPSDGFETLLATLRSTAARVGTGQWIIGAGWGPAVAEHFNAEGALRTLDQASPNNPVVLRDISYHSRIANSAAILAAGIDAVKAQARPGEIVLDPATSRPTGLFHEAAAAAIDAATPAYSTDQLTQASWHGVQLLNSLGVTGFNLAVASRRTVAAFQRLDNAGELTARMAAYIDHGSPLSTPRDGIGAEFVATRHELRSQRVFVDFAKFFMDGVPSLRTASVLRDYADGTRGDQSHYKVEELADLIAPLDRDGVAAKVHAVGDRAIREVLDAIEVVRTRNGPGRRHQIAHAVLVREEDIPRMRALDVVADLCPPMWFPSPTTKRLAEMLGDDYVARSHPTRDILSAGVLAAAGTDWPCIAPTPSPWPGMSSLMTRRNPYGLIPGQHRPEQCLELESALPLFTRNPAIAMNLDHEIGSLEPGKSADIIVLDQDISAVPPEQVVETKVLATYFEGRCVYGGV